MEVFGVVIVILLAVAVTLIVSYFIVRYYEDSTDSHCVTTFASMSAIAISLFCALLIPVDIYTVSSQLNSDGTHVHPTEVSHASDSMKYLYYAMYALMFLFAFFLMPYAYFYFEEGIESDAARERRHQRQTADHQKLSSSASSSSSSSRSVDLLDRDQQDIQRDAKCRAFKWMLGFAFVFIVLLVIGIVVQNEDRSGKDWKDRLSGSFSAGDKIMTFCTSCLAFIGIVGWVSYGAYGLASMPISLMLSAPTPSDARRPLMRGDKKAPQTRDDMEAELQAKSQLRLYIASRYDLPARQWPEEDRKKYNELLREENRLRARLNNQEVKETADFQTRCWNCCAPLRIPFGIIFLCISILIVVSLFMSSIDKLQHSDCKASCGYTLDHPTLGNPIDLMLKEFSKVFPIDFFVFGGLIVYIFFCILSGMISLGVRLLIFKLYNIRKHRTMPNGLIFGTWLIMMVVLALNMEMLTFSPQYATFGEQFYMKADNSTGTLTFSKESCTIDMVDSKPLGVDDDVCIMTQVGKFIHLININLPFFGAIFFWANILFLAVFVFSLIYQAIFRAKQDYGSVQAGGEEDWFFDEP
eukprot:TRINITY_DN2472_c1_g1_i1.p1 TRINITY_DN2472_c1_g1~~TRINITY_DN2472_c1_g1_i1.p1  ORF type:complete len:582 (+),score=128.69 TRINITY_DN2472_c1_g1_i1:67-1812(+)